jgi:type VI secretion system protein
MFEERLLDRIARLEDPQTGNSEPDLKRAIASVIQYLQRMLNTRQGSVPIADDFGVPDMTNFQGKDLSDTAHGMADIIRRFISRYEPRLDKVRISFEPEDRDVLSLRFKLEGVLVRKNQAPVVFETVVKSSGRVEVSD